MDNNRFRRIIQALMQSERGELPEHVQQEAVEALKGDVPEQHARDINVLLTWHQLDSLPDKKSFEELTHGTSSLVAGSLKTWYATLGTYKKEAEYGKALRGFERELGERREQLKQESAAVLPNAEKKREAAIQQDPFEGLNITVLSAGINSLQERGANITLEKLERKIVQLRRSGVKPTEEHVIRELAAEHGVKPPVIRKTRKPG